jgi:hypothetical protein
VRDHPCLPGPRSRPRLTPRSRKQRLTPRSRDRDQAGQLLMQNCQRLILVYASSWRLSPFGTDVQYLFRHTISIRGSLNGAPLPHDSNEPTPGEPSGYPRVFRVLKPRHGDVAVAAPDFVMLTVLSPPPRLTMSGDPVSPQSSWPMNASPPLMQRTLTCGARSISLPFTKP